MPGMRVAKAHLEDIERLKKYLLTNEQRSGRNSRTFPHGWRRVVWAADLLIEQCCDSTEDHLAISPYFQELHVAPEQ
jgi:hypothetical protein